MLNLKTKNRILIFLSIFALSIILTIFLLKTLRNNVLYFYSPSDLIYKNNNGSHRRPNSTKRSANTITRSSSTPTGNPASRQRRTGQDERRPGRRQQQRNRVHLVQPGLWVLCLRHGERL